MLVELTGATGVLARNDARVRLLEGLEQRVEVVHGEVPEQVAVVEGGVEYAVDARHGQKTGLFLDQREVREAAAVYARGRALDCFAYDGFSQGSWRATASVSTRWRSPARRWAGSPATASPISCRAKPTSSTSSDTWKRPATDSTRDRPRSAGVCEEQSLGAEGDRRLQGHQPARRGCSPRGGTSSRAVVRDNVDEATFAEVVYEASVDSHVQVTVVGSGCKVAIWCSWAPETYYLKCFILRRLG